ncbi:PREDICTED: zinc finger BED domain-containing protein RICESLEEPER 2-like [Tarenaya hassleriana]|uniref:zinc finger BED domain-containing protein RICESLEEPER 2-like n=1 Tax=Tarenaya hassleriana TaxID=28532 RepID=UPI00053C8B5D|nr:PREDICTED: zinc finger BED domain-containing protein RICESLEEPER 2-like [Tarenaya hassleriana]
MRGHHYKFNPQKHKIKNDYPDNAERNGTSTLRRHLVICKGMPSKFIEMSEMLAQDEMIIAKKIDGMMVRKFLAMAIIEHDLPFSFVEYKRVRQLLKYMNPDFNPISRNTIVADVLRLHQGQKEKLKREIASISNRICLTADVWRSIAIEGYICITGHYVDNSWKLNSKILSFSAMPPPHSGNELAKKVLDCLKDWGIEKKIFSLTLDNASANDTMQSILKDQLCLQYGLLCDGKFFHVRCYAHILNLIVQEGLKVVDSALYKIRESVKYVKWSEGRMKMFKEYCEQVGVETGTGLHLDIPTRWNSTYTMLKVAIKYERAFSSLQLLDRSYKYNPSSQEWQRGEKICDFLEPFYEITNLFFGSKYPTSNLYFFQVWRIECLLKDYMTNGEDEMIESMANNMKEKFDKYWEEYNITFALAAVLDPRMKLELLEFAYNEVDPTNSKEKIDIVFKAYERRTAAQEERSALEIYLDDKRLEMNEFDDIDVLQFWKNHKQRYGNLTQMACDILSIPITTVASESSFSIGSRLLNKYRSRLCSSNVEALICTRNWLIGYEIGVNGEECDGEDNDHIEVVVDDDTGKNT